MIQTNLDSGHKVLRLHDPCQPDREDLITRRYSLSFARLLPARSASTRNYHPVTPPHDFLKRKEIQYIIWQGETLTALASNGNYANLYSGSIRYMHA